MKIIFKGFKSFVTMCVTHIKILISELRLYHFLVQLRFVFKYYHTSIDMGHNYLSTDFYEHFLNKGTSAKFWTKVFIQILCEVIGHIGDKENTHTSINDICFFLDFWLPSTTLLSPVSSDPLPPLNRPSKIRRNLWTVPNQEIHSFLSLNLT